MLRLRLLTDNANIVFKIVNITDYTGVLTPRQQLLPCSYHYTTNAHRFEDRRDEFFRTKLWARWVYENSSLHRNWWQVMEQIRGRRTKDTTDTASAPGEDDVRVQP